MPGILPMKVIKCGTATQSRIAQACDRCRSKKIRCDGISPTCTQCLTVGFECKTSDKLSRRAFPRGYTESLEERVRQLENEVRELKGLLDEKEEKIDLICKVRSGTGMHRTRLSPPIEAAPSRKASNDALEVGNHITITQSPAYARHDVDTCAVYAGPSSIKSLTRIYMDKLSSNRQSTGTADISQLFYEKRRRTSAIAKPPAHALFLGRSSTDRLINVFFQEIAPLFPIVHRPTILKSYNEYLESSLALGCQRSIHLHLVFSIAAISMQDFLETETIDALETQWASRIVTTDDNDSLSHMQSLVLASLYHSKRASNDANLQFLGQAVALSNRLGLHLDQALFDHGPLVSETRKRCFWALCTLDSFAAAHLGLSPMIDVQASACELPRDLDDESITQTEYTPVLPGELSKISSALALFRLAKILNTILRDLYSPKPSHRIPLSAITTNEVALRDWLDELPSHLRLRFDQDKPSTNVISDRSPLLSLAYQYVRILLSKTFVLAADAPRCNFLSAVLGIADSSKKVLQILDLLSERCMIFAFCINPSDIILQAICGLLLQSLELEHDSSLFKESLKMCCEASLKLQQRQHQKNAHLVLWLDEYVHHIGSECAGRSSDANMPQADGGLKSRGIKGIAQRSHHRHEQHWNSDHLVHVLEASSDAWNTLPQSVSRKQPFKQYNIEPSTYLWDVSPRHRQGPSSDTDSFILSPYSASLDHYPPSARFGKPSEDRRDWQKLLSDLDCGQHNIHDVIYGGPGGDYCSVASASPEHTRQVDHDLAASAESLNHTFWPSDNVWGLANRATERRIDHYAVLGSLSQASPGLMGYTDFGYPILIPDESSPSSVNTLDAEWIQELDPLLRIAN